MQNMMNDQNVMNNPAIKEHLESMKKNMATMMESMNGFLNNMEKIQKIQESNLSKK